MPKAIKLTDEGLKKLKEELEYLKTTGRTEIAEKIKTARGYGDLSENSEYDEAKNDQAKIEARITELEGMLKNVEIIAEKKRKPSAVVLGSTVKVRDIEFDEELTFKIVGSAEADPDKGLLSDESPVGKGLIGSKVGDLLKVEVPAGEIDLEVLSISK